MSGMNTEQKDTAPIKKTMDAKMAKRLENLLEQINSMPKDPGGEKAPEAARKRWQRFKQDPYYEDLITDILNCKNELFLEQLGHMRAGNRFQGYALEGLNHKTNLDAEVFLQSLRQAVGQFQPKEGKPVNEFFFSCLWKLYEQNFSKAKKINTQAEYSQGTRTRNAAKLEKLYYEFRNFQKLHPEYTEQETRKRFTETFAGQFSKNSIQAVFERADVLIISDHGIDEEGEEYSILDMIKMEASPEEKVLEAMDQERAAEILEWSIQQYNQLLFESNRHMKIRDKELYRVFITRDILRELKCLGTGEAFYMEMPAGNDDIYEVLRQSERFLMKTLFVDEYLEAAIQESPEDRDTLYGVYYNLVKNGFKLTNDQIVKILNEDKQKLSRFLHREYEALHGALKKEYLSRVL